MIMESIIFGGDQGFDDVSRQRIEWNGCSVLSGKPRQELPIRGVEHRGQINFGVLQLLKRWKGWDEEQHVNHKQQDASQSSTHNAEAEEDCPLE